MKLSGIVELLFLLYVVPEIFKFVYIYSYYIFHVVFMILQMSKIGYANYMHLFQNSVTYSEFLVYTLRNCNFYILIIIAKMIHYNQLRGKWPWDQYWWWSWPSWCSTDLSNNSYIDWLFCDLWSWWWDCS